MRLDSSGRLGLGTSSPGTNLDIVVGSGTATQKLGSSSVSGGSYLNLHGASTSKTWFIGANYNFAGVLEFTQSTANGGTTPSSTPAMVLSAVGNLGVGTASPASLLDVSGSEPIFWMRDTSAYGDGEGPALYFNALDSGSVDRNVARIVAGASGSNSGILSFQTRVSGTTAERARIDSSGNVGIGTTSPAHKLVISNGGAQGIEFNWDGVGSSNYIQSYNRSTSAYLPFTYYASEHKFHYGQSQFEAARIDSSGRLLVGTTTASFGWL
jgi:hypothetical protein